MANCGPPCKLQDMMTNGGDISASQVTLTNGSCFYRLCVFLVLCLSSFCSQNNQRALLTKGLMHVLLSLRVIEAFRHTSSLFSFILLFFALGFIDLKALCKIRSNGWRMQSDRPAKLELWGSQCEADCLNLWHGCQGFVWSHMASMTPWTSHFSLRLGVCFFFCFS